MNSVVEKRRAAIINIIYFALIIALFYFLLKFAFPLFFPFIAAFIVASILNRPVTYLSEKTKVKRSFFGVLSVVLLLTLCFGIFFFIIVGIIEKLRGFYQFLLSKLQNAGSLINDIKLWILSATNFLPDALKGVLHENITLFFDSITENGVESLNIDWASLLSKGGQLISGAVTHIPAFIISSVVSVISCVFMISDYDRIKHFFTAQLSKKEAEKLFGCWRLGISSLKKMVKAYCLILFITFSELSVGLYIMKWAKIFDSPYIFLISMTVAAIDIIPVLGTGTILIPWAVYSIVTGSVPFGIGLIIMYAVILIIRQIIEPKLVAGQVGLPPVATIIAMYIGTKTLGVLGFFILPFSVVLLKVFNDAGLIHIFKNVIDEKVHHTSDKSEA